MSNTLRLALLALIFYCIPQQGISYDYPPLITKIFDHLDSRDFDAVNEDFEEFAASFDSTEDERVQLNDFLEHFVAQLNFRYGLSVTVQDLCRLTLENIDIYDIPLEYRDEFIARLEEMAAE